MGYRCVDSQKLKHELCTISPFTEQYNRTTLMIKVKWLLPCRTRGLGLDYLNAISQVRSMLPDM